MNSCPTCSSQHVRKYGMIDRIVMTHGGKRNRRIQRFQCANNHVFRLSKVSDWDDSFVELVIYIYLRCLSLNTTIDIVRMFYKEELLTKSLILTFIETVADALPTIDDIDRLYNPLRSGYLALDGVWFQYGKEQIVILVCFDPETFDVIQARWETDETELGYTRLLTDATNKVGATKIKGIYGDGDNGLIKALKRLLPHVPFQLCVFHKELRMGQVVPIKSIHVSKQLTAYQKHDMKVFQTLFRDVIYAETKEASVANLERLKQYVHQTNNERFAQAYRSLVHNFKYTLTHFDYPYMKRDNNLIECFNSCLKPRLKLMKGFKKKENLDRYLKLFLLEFRFHELKESRFKERNSKSSLEVAGVLLPKYYNFLTLLRQELHLSYKPS